MMQVHVHVLLPFQVSEKELQTLLRGNEMTPARETAMRKILDPAESHAHEKIIA